MRIDRNNYEEFFILYLDQELAQKDRLAVESFVEQNPDLKEELELLSQFRLQPDEEISFPDKSVLFKNGELSAENMLLYLDGELSPEESRETKKAIEADEILGKEFSLLKQTKLEAEEIRFPDKSILYRHTAPARIISIRWRRVAAAVIILLLGGAGYLFLNDRNAADPQKPEIVKTDKPGVPNTPSPKVAEKSTIDEVYEVSPSLANNHEVNEASVAGKENKPGENIKVQAPQSAETPLPIFSNNLPEETQPAIASLEPIEKTRKDPEYDFSNTTVTSLSAQPSNIRVASYPSEDISDEEQEPAGGKKNKLRGPFRKVTRTFEKRTNIDATDEDGKLLVAGLAIKL